MPFDSVVPGGHCCCFFGDDLLPHQDHQQLPEETGNRSKVQLFSGKGSAILLVDPIALLRLGLLFIFLYTQVQSSATVFFSGKRCNVETFFSFASKSPLMQTICEKMVALEY